MLFLGYLYGIRSENRLVEEVKVNIAYRWFLGYTLEDKIPDASVIWQNRIRRFNGTDIPEQIFNEILKQAISRGLVGGKGLVFQLMQSQPKKKSFFQHPTATASHCTKANVQQPFLNSACCCELAVHLLIFEKHQSCVCTAVTLSHRFKSLPAIPGNMQFSA